MRVKAFQYEAIVFGIEFRCDNIENLFNRQFVGGCILGYAAAL